MTPIYPETEKLISAMSPDELWEKYLRYIGAGAVIFGGLVSLIKSTPTIAASIWGVAAGAFDRSRRSQERTDRDLPLPLLLLGLVGLAYVMYRFVMVRFGDNQTALWATVAVPPNLTIPDLPWGLLGILEDMVEL